jgi:ribose/xylose/arabinose/galactoside ABC-type transport system permease subunit
MAVHFLWEVVLLLATAALAVLLYRENPATLGGAALDSLLVSAAALGLLALGAGLTLRAGAPNLALGPVAVASALHFAENSDRGVVRALTPAAIAVVVLGLLVALFVVGFHLPGWAVSLAAGLGIIALIQQRSTPVTVVQANWHPTRSALYLFCGFAAVTLLGGLFGTIKPVRRAVGRFRPVADPAKRRGAVAAILTAIAITVSMIFAMLAGVLLAAGGTGRVTPTPGMEWSGLALGAALLAGTSAFGRRGGVFGTLLSVMLLTLFITYAEQRRWGISRYAIAAVAMAAGVLVTRLVEAYGRPRAVRNVAEEWATQPPTTTTSSWGATRAERPESWSSALPAQPTGHRTDPWGTDSWGGAGR